MLSASVGSNIQSYRLDRVKRQFDAYPCDALVLFDPVNIRYLTGSRNMQVWTMHHYCRYAFMSADGVVILFEVPGAMHLVDKNADYTVRPGFALDYAIVGRRAAEIARRWARDMLDLLNEHTSGRRLAIDRADLLLTHACMHAGIDLADGKPIMEHARAVKSLEEIQALTASLRTCDQSVAWMRARIAPGMRECEALALLIRASIDRGGEYPETRLLTSGPRTNPWFQETSDRVMQDGDLLSFDTDLIGPMGFYNDISRSWVIGDAAPNDAQRRCYEIAHRQLQHNIELLRPGVGFLEYSDRAYRLPEDYIVNRYADVAHGCGMDVEYPFIWYREDGQWGAYDGVFEENMVVCVECYAGKTGGREGVKLEQPVWITADGPRVLSDTPLEEHYL